MGWVVQAARRLAHARGAGRARPRARAIHRREGCRQQVGDLPPFSGKKKVLALLDCREQDVRRRVAPRLVPAEDVLHRLADLAILSG